MSQGIKASHVYLAMGALAFIMLFVDTGSVPLPTAPTGIFILLLIIAASQQWWEALKAKGPAALITTLPPSSGGHSTIHPNDIAIATSSPNDDMPNFCVVATGGIFTGGVEWRGSENFFVFPPQHMEQTGAGVVIRTRFRQVKFEQLHDFIQAELLKFNNFDPRMVSVKKNLWFGVASTLDGTATTKTLLAESHYLDQTEQLNRYKKMIDDLYARNEKGKKKDDNVFNVNLRQ
jgi:hypothetical protein